MSHEESKYDDKTLKKKLEFQSVPFTSNLKFNNQTNGYPNITVQNKERKFKFLDKSSTNFLSVTLDPVLPETFDLNSEKNSCLTIDIQETSSSTNDSPIFIIFRCLNFLITNKKLMIVSDGVATITSLYFLFFYFREVNWIKFSKQWMNSPVWVNSSLLLYSLWAIMLVCIVLLSAHATYRLFYPDGKKDKKREREEIRGQTKTVKVVTHLADKTRSFLRWLCVFRSIISIAAATTLMCSINASKEMLEKSSVALLGINFLTFVISIFLRCYIKKYTLVHYDNLSDGSSEDKQNVKNILDI